MLVKVKTPRPPTAGQPKAETYLATKTYLTTKSLLAVVDTTAKTPKKKWRALRAVLARIIRSLVQPSKRQKKNGGRPVLFLRLINLVVARSRKPRGT